MEHDEESRAKVVITNEIYRARQSKKFVTSRLTDCFGRSSLAMTIKDVQGTKNQITAHLVVSKTFRMSEGFFSI